MKKEGGNISGRGTSKDTVVEAGKSVLKSWEEVQGGWSTVSVRMRSERPAKSYQVEIV